MQNASTNFREFSEVAVKLICQSSFFFYLSLSVPIYLCLSLSHLRSLSGISSVSRPLSQLLYLTPLQGARRTFQRSL